MDYKKAFEDATSRMADAKKRGDQSAFQKANQEAGDAQKRMDAERKKNPKSLASRLLGGS